MKRSTITVENLSSKFEFMSYKPEAIVKRIKSGAEVKVERSEEGFDELSIKGKDGLWHVVAYHVLFTSIEGYDTLCVRGEDGQLHEIARRVA